MFFSQWTHVDDGWRQRSRYCWFSWSCGSDNVSQSGFVFHSCANKGKQMFKVRHWIVLNVFFFPFFQKSSPVRKNITDFFLFSQLPVLKDFTLSLNVPSYLIRGEEIVLEINVINHLEMELTVREAEFWRFPSDVWTASEPRHNLIKGKYDMKYNHLMIGLKTGPV